MIGRRLVDPRSHSALRQRWRGWWLVGKEESRGQGSATWSGCGTRGRLLAPLHGGPQPRRAAASTAQGDSPAGAHEGGAVTCYLL